MLAHPADGGGERLGEDQVAEHLDGVRVELVDAGALVAAVEVAEEVAAVACGRAASSAGRLGQRLQRRSGAGRPAAAGGWPATSSDATTFEAMSVFSRSKAARWRSGSSTWRRSRSSRCSPVRPPGVVRTRACSTTDGRWIVGDVVVPVDDPRVEAEGGLVLGVEARPRARAGGRRRRSPRTRRRRRRARRRRGPGRPPRASPRAWPPSSACLPRSGSGWQHPLGRARWRSWPARAGPAPGPRPGNDHSGTTMGWPSAS